MSEHIVVRWKRLLIGMLAVLLLAVLASSSAQAGFVRQDGKRYYYRTSGRKVKGWLKKGKKTYYLDPDQDGAVTVGYLKLGKKGYYFRKNGTLVKGAFATDPLGHTYYAARSGVLYRGLRKIGKRYYYFDRSSHAMQTGWVKTSRGTYYMKGAGKLRGTAVTGWLRKDGLRYYFNNAGRMVTGLVRIGGRQYYFDPQSGAMATGTVTLKGKTYNFGTNGIKVKESVTGPWSVKVNQSTCTVTVYRGSTPVKAFACSVGLNGATPDGTFRIMDHLRWHELLGPSWGQWCSHITWDILFHSIPYSAPYDKYSMAISGYNKLGQAASHGCVRLAAINAKYIYDNVPVGSTVVIFHGSAKNDPLGKPMTPYVGSWNHTYDPTDPTI